MPLITMDRSLVFILRSPDLSAGSQRSPKPHPPSTPVWMWVVACTSAIQQWVQNDGSTSNSSHDTVSILHIRSVLGVAIATSDRSFHPIASLSWEVSRVAAKAGVSGDRSPHLSCVIWASYLTFAFLSVN